MPAGEEQVGTCSDGTPHAPEDAPAISTSKLAVEYYYSTSLDKICSCIDVHMVDHVGNLGSDEERPRWGRG